MKLSIIPANGTVCEDELCYINLIWTGTPANIHALQWDDDVPIDVDGEIYHGWLEFVDGKPNEYIQTLPPWVSNATAAWTEANTPKPVTPPTAEKNKVTAENILSQTDWTATVDISNPQYSNPYLMNQDEFLAYRSTVRDIAVNPVAGYITWPTLPTEKWSS